jgi:hypothetical protein
LKGVRIGKSWRKNAFSQLQNAVFEKSFKFLADPAYLWTGIAPVVNLSMRINIFHYMIIAGFAVLCNDAPAGNAPIAPAAPPPTPAPVAPVPSAPIAPIAPVAPIGSSDIAPAAPQPSWAPIAPAASDIPGVTYTYTPGAAVGIISNSAPGGGRTNSVFWITNAPYGNPTSGYTNKSVHVLPPAVVNTNTTSQIR